MQRVKLAKESEATVPAKTLPHRLSSKLSDGVHHYTTDSGVNVALIKEGDTYYFYDYVTDNIFKPMTMQEANKALKSHYTSSMQATNGKIAAAMPLAEATADLSAETKTAADSTEVESAVENSDFGTTEGIETADFIEEVNRMIDESRKSKRKKRIGVVSQNHANIINNLMQTVNPEFSADGYELWIDGTSASHIEIRHGKNGEADKSMASREAKMLIPWAAQNADRSEFIVEDGEIKLSDRFFNKDGSRAPEIRLQKTLNGDTIYVAECVPDATNKRIYITSAYIKKGSKGQLLNMDNKSSPQPTPEASFDGNATTTSIPDSSKKINSFEKNSSEKVSSYEKLKAQNAEIAKFAEENIKDYKKLNDPSRRAVRAVIRQGRAHGLSDADIITIASVSAHSGAKIKFSKADCKRTNKKGETVYVDGFYDGDTDTITVNPEKTRSTDRLLLHELLHDIVMHLGGTKKGFKLYKKLVEQALNNMSEEQQNAIVEKYQEMGESRDSVLTEEILAHYGEAFANKAFFEAMLTERQSLGKRILNFFKSAVTDYAGDERLTRSARKFQRAFKKLFDDYSAINQNTNAYDSNLRLSEGEKRNAAAVDNYSEEEYNNFGWARENNVLNAAENEDLRSKFAGATKGLISVPKSKSGEYMIAVGGNGINNKIAFMKGDIDSPIITRILEIDADNETTLSEIRSDLYEIEKRGIQQETGGVFRRYDSFNFRNNGVAKRNISKGQGHNNQLGAKRSSGSGKTQRIKEIVFEENGTERITYSDGSVEIRNSQNDIKSDSNKRYALSADFDIAKDAISSKETESKLKQLKNYAKNMTPSSILATQIQFTNTQAGIEAAGKALGIKEIEAEVQAVRASRSQAQEMLGGNQWTIMGDKYVKQGDGFYKIIEPIQKKGKEYWERFQKFLFHRHNIDRMSLEERSIAKNEAKKTELAELQTKLKELKAQLAEVNAELKDLKLQRGREAVLKRSKLNDTKQALTAEQNALEKNVSKLRQDIESFKPEENKAVLGKEENGETVAVTADESRVIVEKYLKLHPEFEAEAEKIYTYLDNLQKMRLDAGLIDETLYKALKEKYPHYVPTYREESKQGASGISGKYNLSVKKTISKAKGSVETLMSLDDSISRMTEQVITAANVNRLANTLYDAATASSQNKKYQPSGW